jgi:hypothetical protein
MNCPAAQPRTARITHYGRVHQTKVFDTDAATNSWLHTNPGWGVLLVNDTGIHVARLDDEGTPPNEDAHQ